MLVNDQLLGNKNFFDSFSIELLSTPPNSEEELPAIVNSRRLYNSCLDEDQIEREGITPILTLINNEFGGWPILQDSQWNSSAFDFTRLLLKLNEYNHFPLYVIASHTNEKNSSINGIRVGLDICFLWIIRNDSSSLIKARLV